MCGIVSRCSQDFRGRGTPIRWRQSAKIGDKGCAAHDVSGGRGEVEKDNGRANYAKGPICNACRQTSGGAGDISRHCFQGEAYPQQTGDRKHEQAQGDLHGSSRDAGQKHQANGCADAGADDEGNEGAPVYFTPEAGQEMEACGDFEQENRGDDFGRAVNERQGGDGEKSKSEA